MRNRDIENAVNECNRFTKLANVYLAFDSDNSEADAADLKRFALDALRSLRKLREEAGGEAETA